MADKKKSIIPTIILSVISIIWIYPIVMILFNSLKVESAITTSGVFLFLHLRPGTESRTL